MRRYTVFVAILGVALTAFAASVFASDDGFARERDDGEDERNAAKDALEGNPPPPLEGLTGWMNTLPDGAPLEWSGLRGKVVLIDFWGVWCGPCGRAIPHVKELAAKHEADGLVVIGIHTDDDADKGPDYVVEENILYPIAFDANNDVIPRFHVDSYPDFYLVDRAGNLRFADIDNDEVDRAIEMLLAEPVPVE